MACQTPFRATPALQGGSGDQQLDLSLDLVRRHNLEWLASQVMYPKDELYLEPRPEHGRGPVLRPVIDGLGDLGEHLSEGVRVMGFEVGIKSVHVAECRDQEDRTCP